MPHLKRFLISLLFRLLRDEEPALSKLTDQQKLDLWSALWENPAIQSYLIQRILYLEKQISQAIIDGKPGNAWIFTGQIKELMEIHHKAKNSMQTKRDILAKAQKLSASQRV